MKHKNVHTNLSRSQRQMHTLIQTDRACAMKQATGTPSDDLTLSLHLGGLFFVTCSPHAFLAWLRITELLCYHMMML